MNRLQQVAEYRNVTRDAAYWYVASEAEVFGISQSVMLDRIIAGQETATAAKIPKPVKGLLIDAEIAITPRYKESPFLQGGVDK